MWLPDLLKKGAILAVQAIVLCGALAFVYNVSPLSEREIEIVVVDKYEVTHSTKPYLIVECLADDIKLCTYRNVTRFEYENTSIGEVAVYRLNQFQFVYNFTVTSKTMVTFVISAICFVLTFGISIPYWINGKREE